MISLQIETIRNISDSSVIFTRGELLQTNGAFRALSEECGEGIYVYEVDGSFGNYRTEIQLNGSIVTSCSCPYPGNGCKHVVAVLLELYDRQGTGGVERVAEPAERECLTAAEIRQLAVEDRLKRSRKEEFLVVQGDMLKGDHLVTTSKGRQYQVTMHDPLTGAGHCSCPDFQVNRLGLCKHLLHLVDVVQKQNDWRRRLAAETFPYIDIYWDSVSGRPRLYHEQPAGGIAPELAALLTEMFAADGTFSKDELISFIPYLSRLEEFRAIRVQEPLLERLAGAAMDHEMAEAAATSVVDIADCLKVTPYPYQQEGIRFGLFRKAVLIGDEMGLGKTLQAIGLALLKKRIFGFRRVLIVTLSSLKQQWQREIERFSDEKGCIIAGSARQRKDLYTNDSSLFKITNYEAVLRDVTIIARFKPDLIVLDEAQRIKNFATKTAQAVKSLPRQHAVVLTGTPLENKLDDLYSLVQFLDPDLFSPLWQFAADHFLLDRRKKGDIRGYINLDRLHERLRPLVIRRRKEEVLEELPELIVNDYFIELAQEQAEMHEGYSRALAPLLMKKFLTPMDMRRIQILLLKMRQACNSTFLIDRETNISPKLDELTSILDEVVVQNGRKVVIFSEWSTMTMLIGKKLSRMGIAFVQLSGQIPVHRRQALIDEFTTNPQCKVFLSTDAGGTGLNLQTADCVINMELPWNPAKLHQRIGRVNRIGQKSRCINVVNLIAKFSIEERIMAGIRLKEDLFKGVFDGDRNEVLFSREKRQELVNLLRQMMAEEPVLLQGAQQPAEELAEDTPHFLNPEVLERQEDYVGEETEVVAIDNEPPHVDPDPAEANQQSAEKMEDVLNQGLGFISSLLEMATGSRLGVAEGKEKLVTIDRATGEVTMKFTLPGFVSQQK